MKTVKDRLFRGYSNTTPPQSRSGSTVSEADTPARVLREAQEIADSMRDPDEETVRQSGNVQKISKKKKDLMTPEQLVDHYKEQIAQEKAGKRKLFHSLVKLANELRRTRETSKPLREQQSYADRNWYEGGLWRAPAVLPGVTARTGVLARQRQAISLSSLFFNLVIVTAFTRVGVAISLQGGVDWSSLFYFAIFWNVWSKEAYYSTRFDTTDLSAQMSTLVTCFVVLFASLSTQQKYTTVDGSRIMMAAAFCALLHCLLHVRVAINTRPSEGHLAQHVVAYAVFNIIMCALECSVWCVGIFVFPTDWDYRWAIFAAGLLLSLRVPRAFMANDFHAACSKRGVLFILLLGFSLQSVVVVASEFFEYQTPTLEHYSFLGAACLMFFCIKLLYVDDSDTLAADHALLVNRTAGFFFNVGQFGLLLSTTVMGSGLNLLTHDYMAATAALPGPAKVLVCGGYSAVLFSTFFIKSMHIKRVPVEGTAHALFISAYVVQTVVLLAVVAVTALMCFEAAGSLFNYIMQNDILLLFCLSGSALFVVVMSWLDEGVELLLYKSAENSREFRIHPFGFWWCLKADMSDEEMKAAMENEQPQRESVRQLSALSPLLGSSAADLSKGGYESLSTGEEV